MRTIRLSLLLLVALSVSGSPVITSVTPSGGPASGGTTVVITGTGFSDVCIVCSPPFGGLSVYFGATRATSEKLINPTRIEVVTPPHPPGPVSVTVNQMNDAERTSFTLPNAFIYTGDWSAEFEPVLFPIFMPPVRGAFGAEFHTTARVASRGEPLDLWGVDTNCTTIDPPITPVNPFRIGTNETPLFTGCSDSVGRFFFARREDVNDLAANLRVADVSGQHESHGVEIPVVRLDDFTVEKIVLLGVPLDPRFRNTLRIYGLPGGAQFVNVTVGGVTHGVPLRPGDGMFEPSYAQFTAFPPAGQLGSRQNTVTVTIEQPVRGIVGPTAVWAFVSVTNNDTQQITVVTPN